MTGAGAAAYRRNVVVRNAAVATAVTVALAAVAVNVSAGSGTAMCEGRPASIEGSGSIAGTPGDDVIVGSGGPDSIVSHGGYDIVCAGDGADYVNGGQGNDRIFGEGGDDHVRAGPDSDLLDGGPGADDLGGGAGPGDDLVTYAGPRVTVTLDGRPNDGRPEERDWIRRDVEGAQGRGTFVGSGRRNLFIVSGTVRAHGGPDVLVVDGRGGSFDGGAGNDSLGKAEDAGPARFFGGPGDDSIDGTDKSSAAKEVRVRDRISCGAGRGDIVTPGLGDRIARDCEDRTVASPFERR